MEDDVDRLLIANEALRAANETLVSTNEEVRKALRSSVRLWKTAAILCTASLVCQLFALLM